MSGGVDSSVVLALLASTSASHNLDLDLRAVFMRNWSPQLAEDAQSPAGVDASVPSDCAWEKDWEDVRRVCAHVGGRGGGGASVRAELVDLSNAYWMQVFEPAVEAWQAGRTPNPDVGCNRCVCPRGSHNGKRTDGGTSQTLTQRDQVWRAHATCAAARRVPRDG